MLSLARNRHNSNILGSWGIFTLRLQIGSNILMYIIHFYSSCGTPSKLNKRQAIQIEILIIITQSLDYLMK